MKPIVFEGISFYPEVNAKKSEADFLKHEAHHGLTVDQLKEVYKLCKQAVAPKNVDKEMPKEEKPTEAK